MAGKFYLVVWWISQTPYAAKFKDEYAASKAADTKNALVITVDGEAKIESIVDWFRRTDTGIPMPVTWKDLEKKKVANVKK